MKRLAVFVVVILVTLSIPATVSATPIEITQNYILGPISADGQTIGGVHQYFDPVTFGPGDTLVFTFLFDQRLQVIDLDGPSDEAFSIMLGMPTGATGWNGTLYSTIEALGGMGDIWSGELTQYTQSSGVGIGWGGAGYNVTSTAGSFTGLRWTVQITSVLYGDMPMTLDSSAFTLYADKISELPTPVPEPASLLLLGTGLAGAALARRRRRTK